VTTYSLRKGTPDKTRADLVVIGVSQNPDAKGANALEVCPGGEAIAAAYGRKFAPLLSSMGFSGKTGEVLRVPTGGTVKSAQLLVIGMGPRDGLTTENVRRAAGVAARNVGNAASVVLALPAIDAAHVRAVADGFLSGGYRYTAYKSGASKEPVAEVAILSDAARQKDSIDALATAQAVAATMSAARDWVNAPANDFAPLDFAAAITEFGKQRKGSGVKIKVYDVDELTELNCGGILGVGMGSENPPCMVKLTWQPDKPRGHIALVGKGITYDSGGLTIKPGGSMATMKFDMAGAAAVVAAIYAIAELKLPVAVTAWAPMAENMISGDAMRPGDVLTMHSGKTVEVLNTDAEGRLVLADALALAAEEKPDAIINIATLTGPCIVALGEKIAGLFGTDDAVAAVTTAAEVSGELVWRLPIPEATREQVRTESKVADLLQHNWVRWGSALYAAAFLQEFVDGLPFAHLDIAGPAYNSGGPWGHVPSGGTGFGIATMVQYVAAVAQNSR
jgi:leucyl aminopeptidase